MRMLKLPSSLHSADCCWRGAAVAAVLLFVPPLLPAQAPAGLQRLAWNLPAATVGPTLFTRLDATTTGLVVANLYDDPAMWGKRYREFMGGGMGSGVAAGDFDRDGRVDLYVSTKTRPGRLYRNLGGWKFADVTEAAGLAEEGSLLGWLKGAVSADNDVIWRQGAIFADVNNDGRLDLYVCRNNAANLLYINQGDGTFQDEAADRGLAVVDGSVMGAFSDYDRDGWLDVLVLTNQVDGTEPSGRPDRLFRNRGDGTFTEVTATAGIAGPTFGHAATWFDYDADGWPDLHVANDFAGPDRLYRNNRDGTFTDVIDTVAPHTPYSSMGADAADIDNDGNIDLLVADMATTTREKDRRGLAASRDDVLMTGTKDGTAPQYMRNALLLNTGTGIFREAASWAGIAATDWTWSVRFEDFDHDGWMDLHVTNGMVREANNSDVLSRMMRALSDQERINVMKRSPPLEESNLAYRNLGGKRFESVTAAWGLTDVGVSFGAATADFDNDGDLDLVYLDYNRGVSVFRNNVTGGNRVQVRLQGTESNRDGLGAIVRVESATIGRQARTMTGARGYAAGSELVAHFGLGSDAVLARLRVEWPSGAVQEFTDLAANESYLIVEHAAAAAPPPTSPARPPLFHRAAKDSGLHVVDKSAPAIPDQEQIFLPFRTDRRGPGVAVADVDGDGHDDLYLAATTGSPARLLCWRDHRYVEESPYALTPSKVEDGPPLLFDADGDGSCDLLVTKASANARAWPAAFQPVLYRNEGEGRYTPTDALPELRLNVGAASAADIDADGDLDLFLGGRSVPGRYPEAARSVLLRNEGGRFVDATAGAPGLATVGLVKSALWRDVDQDGRVDLIVALEWDFVRYFHNDGQHRFTDHTETAGFTSGGRGWWNSLASADLNRDGRPDFVAGNLGLNTTYTASPAQPATLFHGDFAQNGTMLVAEAGYDGDTLYPMRARGDLGARLPAILRKYPQNDDFARATMAQVFGAQPLAAATKREADNFSSGAYLSQPDGTYRFEPFPRVAQIGPIQGILAADLDGDGLVDVAAVQNTDIATPRFHGGIGMILQGRGDGHFEVLAPTRSGFIVPGNARALVLLDPDNDGCPDLFLTRHGGSSDMFANQSTTARWLRILLEGPKGNPAAVGARVELTFSNGTTIQHETAVGGGWLSQSAPGIFAAVPAGVERVKAVVHWPDGLVSRHDDAPERGRWILRRPPAN